MSVKEAVLLEGKLLAAKIQDNIKENISSFAAKGLPQPRLLAMQVSKDPSSEWYLGQQKKLAEKLGILFNLLPADHFPDQPALMNRILQANDDSSVTGVFLTMPLPKGFDSDQALTNLNPSKDVEAITPPSLGLIVFLPLAMALLKGR